MPVASYAKKVADPQPDELEKFFEAHKNQYAMPDSPEPGFRVPHRIAVQYFRAETDKFADAKTITEAQIKEEYEKQKDIYDRVGAALFDREKEEKAEKGEKPAGAPPKQGKPAAEEKRLVVPSQKPAAEGNPPLK